MTIREVVVAHFKPTAAAGAVFQLVDAVEVITFLAIALNEIIRDVREGQGVRE